MQTRMKSSFAGVSILGRTFTRSENWMTRRVVPFATNSHPDSWTRAHRQHNERSCRGNPFDLAADFVFAPNDLAK